MLPKDPSTPPFVPTPQTSVKASCLARARRAGPASWHFGVAACRRDKIPLHASHFGLLRDRFERPRREGIPVFHQSRNPGCSSFGTCRIA